MTTNIPSSPPPLLTLSLSINRSTPTTISKNLPSPYARPVPGFVAATLTSLCPISTKCVSHSRLYPSHLTTPSLDLTPLLHKSGPRCHPQQGPVLCRPSSRPTCSRRCRVGQKPRLQTRFVTFCFIRVVTGLCRVSCHTSDSVHLFTYNHSTVHLNPSHHEPTSPTRTVNDRPTRSFPVPPRRRQASAGTVGVFDAPTSDTSTNPFLPTNHVHDHPQPPIHPAIRIGTVSSPTIVPSKPHSLPPPTPPPAPAHHASNPFVNRTPTVPTRSSPSPERRLPPLPPRKVPPVLPPRSFPSSAS